jgi:hypothetical protein
MFYRKIAKTPKESVNFTQNKVSGDSPNLALLPWRLSRLREKSFFKKRITRRKTLLIPLFNRRKFPATFPKSFTNSSSTTLCANQSSKISTSIGRRARFFCLRGAEKIAVSRWISPKRTRSYPYERVYDTLAFRKKSDDNSGRQRRRLGRRARFFAMGHDFAFESFGRSRHSGLLRFSRKKHEAKRSNHGAKIR